MYVIIRRCEIEGSDGCKYPGGLVSYGPFLKKETAVKKAPLLAKNFFEKIKASNPTNAVIDFYTDTDKNTGYSTVYDARKGFESYRYEYVVELLRKA